MAEDIKILWEKKKDFCKQEKLRGNSNQPKAPKIFRYMKQLVLNFLLFLFSCSSPVTRNDAVIRFKGQEYDFGTISLKEEVYYGFEFSNPGKMPLVM
ncbi:MAG: hypothetical protein PHG29_06855 [Prolixibacteraceae bacterium]|nr:hypothetical protein [Prolixibacteraceae bacterium]